MVELIRWFRGYVVFELVGKFPERFINICARHGISLFNPVPCNGTFAGSMLLCDYKNIRAVARKCSVRLSVKERHGLPFLVSRYRARSGLLAGMAAFIVIIIVMQSFVWTVEFNGLDTISTAEIAQILKESGVSVGSFKGNLDLQAIQRKVMLEKEEIGWMSINIMGTKAEVEIKEKDKKPQILTSDTPCNIKASADGVIVSMNTKKGKAVVPVGSAVKKGQLLVSGVVENNLGDISFVHSDAQIISKTERQIAFETKISGEYKAVEDTALRQRFDFFWFSIPVTFNSVRGDYSSTVVKENLIFNNITVPCGLSSEYCTVYKNMEYTLDKKRGEEVLSAQEALYRLFVLSDCETVDVTKNLYADNDIYRANVTYKCTEEIGVKENFVVN